MDSGAATPHHRMSVNLPGWPDAKAAGSVRAWAAGILLALILLPIPAFAQQEGNVQLEANEQIFCVLAALNAGGYDAGWSSSVADPAREEVRNSLAGKKIPVLPEVEKFYAEHRVPNDPGAELGQYISLALLLGPPPDFRLTVDEAELPPDAKAVVEWVPLLKSFYAQADLLGLWSRLQPRYRAAVESYTNDVRRSVVQVDAYLRSPAGGYLGRTYSIYVDLLGVPEQVQARIYGSNYYLVVTSSKEPKLGEIRHQYLHFLLDPLAVKYSYEIHQKGELRALVYQAPILAPDFKEDYPLLVTECLIRAAELRMDKRSKLDAEKSLNEMTASGLILVRYFYEALQSFEQQDSPMTSFFKTMVLGINPRAEEKRLATVKFTPLPPAGAAEASVHAAPPVGEEDRLLDQADNLFYRSKYNDAKVAYQTVLEKLDPKS